MNVRTALTTLAATSGLALAACGSDDKSSSSTAEQSSPKVAIAEIAETKAGLDKAVSELRGGSKKAAEDTVAETYLQHFEKVEDPLGEVDPELKEKLEEAISGELRTQIRNGAPVAQVRKHVDQVKADLDTAEEKLK
jgi:DNA anti-recombination protein RmuC